MPQLCALERDLLGTPYWKQIVDCLGPKGRATAAKAAAVILEYVERSGRPEEERNSWLSRFRRPDMTSAGAVAQLLALQLIREHGLNIRPFPTPAQSGLLTPDYELEFGNLRLVGDAFAISEGLPEGFGWWGTDELLEFGLEDDGTQFLIEKPRGVKYQQPGKKSLVALLRSARDESRRTGFGAIYLAEPFKGISVLILPASSGGTCVLYGEGCVNFDFEAGLRQALEKQHRYRSLVDNRSADGFLAVPVFLWAFTCEEVVTFGRKLYSPDVKRAPFRLDRADGDARRLAGVLSLHGGFFSAGNERPLVTLFPNPEWGERLSGRLPEGLRVYDVERQAIGFS